MKGVKRLLRGAGLVVWAWSIALTCIAEPLAASATASATATEATDQIEQFHQALLSMMAFSSHAERETYIQPVVAELFDLERIAKVSLGRTWRSLDVVQQSEFVTLQLNLIAATYANRFAENNGQRFDILTTNVSEKGAVVRAQIISKQGTAVALDYVSKQGRVFNVVANGVSDLSLRRADYSQIIKAQSYAALLEDLRAKLQTARIE